MGIEGYYSVWVSSERSESSFVMVNTPTVLVGENRDGIRGEEDGGDALMVFVFVKWVNLRYEC